MVQWNSKNELKYKCVQNKDDNTFYFEQQKCDRQFFFSIELMKSLI